MFKINSRRLWNWIMVASLGWSLWAAQVPDASAATPAVEVEAPIVMTDPLIGEKIRGFLVLEELEGAFIGTVTDVYLISRSTDISVPVQFDLDSSGTRLHIQADFAFKAIREAGLADVYVIRLVNSQNGDAAILDFAISHCVSEICRPDDAYYRSR